MVSRSKLEFRNDSSFAEVMMMQDRVGRKNVNRGLNTPPNMSGSLTDQMVIRKHGLESKEGVFKRARNGQWSDVVAGIEENLTPPLP